jgi:hypothetical protein
MDTWTANLQIQQSARLEASVPSVLRVQPEPILARKENITEIMFDQLCSMDGSLPVGGRSDNQSDQRLLAPVEPRKLRGEPVQ